MKHMQEFLPSTRGDARHVMTSQNRLGVLSFQGKPLDTEQALLVAGFFERLNTIFGPKLYDLRMGDEITADAVKAEYCEDILSLTPYQLDSALSLVKRGGSVTFIDIPKILSLAAKAVSAPYHKPFSQQDKERAASMARKGRLLSKPRALPPKENKSRLAGVIAEHGL